MDARLEAFADRLLQPDLIAGDWPAYRFRFKIDAAPSRMQWQMQLMNSLRYDIARDPAGLDHRPCVIFFTASEARAGQALAVLADEGVGVSP
jgi:hypothetical protein